MFQDGAVGRGRAQPAAAGEGSHAGPEELSALVGLGAAVLAACLGVGAAGRCAGRRAGSRRRQCSGRCGRQQRGRGLALMLLPQQES